MGRPRAHPSLHDGDELAAMLARHGSAAAVARALGVSDTAVRRARDSFGLPKRDPGRPRSHADKLADLAWLRSHALRKVPVDRPERLRSYTEIAARMTSAGLSVSVSTVYRSLQRAGVRSRADRDPGHRANRMRT
jgi:hypothetical protein